MKSQPNRYERYDTTEPGFGEITLLHLPSIMLYAMAYVGYFPLGRETYEEDGEFNTFLSTKPDRISSNVNDTNNNSYRDANNSYAEKLQDSFYS